MIPEGGSVMNLMEAVEHVFFRYAVYPEPVAAGTRFYLGNRGNLFQIIVYS